VPVGLTSLMPKLKASSYDYIIFDMPPVNQTSVTARAARVMDMVLLVIESGRTSQDLAKQATELLAESKANVSAVLNKYRKYVPASLSGEM
jgi:polysaccharide biosynthesis transport protein